VIEIVSLNGTKSSTSRSIIRSNGMYVSVIGLKQPLFPEKMLVLRMTNKREMSA
jgi:hypothetical protein